MQDFFSFVILYGKASQEVHDVLIRCGLWVTGDDLLDDGVLFGLVELLLFEMPENDDQKLVVTDFGVGVHFEWGQVLDWVSVVVGFQKRLSSAWIVKTQHYKPFGLKNNVMNLLIDKIPLERIKQSRLQHKVTNLRIVVSTARNKQTKLINSLDKNVHLHASSLDQQVVHLHLAAFVF